MTKVAKTEKVKRVKRAKIEAVDDGGAVLLLGAGIVGFLLWLRSRKAKEEEALATQFQFQQRTELNRSRAIKHEGKQVSQIWEPHFSSHWRGG